MRLHFVAIEANGASTVISKVPDALRVDLILGTARGNGPAPGGYSWRASGGLFGSDLVSRGRRRVERAAL